MDCIPWRTLALGFFFRYLFPVDCLLKPTALGGVAEELSFLAESALCIVNYR